MGVCNNLATELEKSLSATDNHFSATDELMSLTRQQCIDKLNYYIEWLKQLNVNSVMILSTPSIDMLCLCYALVLSNKTYIPVHTSTSSELLNTYLETYQVDLLVVQPLLFNQFDVEFKSKLKKESSFFYYLPPNGQQTFCLLPGIIFFTSGTSAQPKAVHYQYNTLHKYLCWCVDEFKLRKEDKFLFSTELSFVASLRPLFIPALTGANLYFINHESSNKLLLITNILRKQKISILNLTPTLFKVLVQHIEKSTLQYTLASIRLILLSGEPIDSAVINHWFTHIKADSVFYNLYGATEYLVPFYKKITGPLSEQERLHLGQLRIGCEYKLVPHASKSYELCIAGDISTAYFDNGRTQTNYINIDNRRYIKTNDFVTVRDKELFFCSRAQRIIKRYSQLVNLDQIEYLLKKFHGSLNFITFADEEHENKIYLIISGTQYDEQLLKQIKQTLKAHLPNYMHPNEYIFMQTPPLTASGKIDYLLLKNKFIHSQINELVDYFKRFFHDQEIDLEARIIDLGLESIDYIEMAEEFLKITGKWLDVSKITDETRIADLDSCLINLNLQKSTFNKAVKLHPMHRAYYIQERKEHREENEIYHISSFCLQDNMDLNKLEKAITETIDNHFILSSKLEYIDHDYFFVSTNPQTNFKLRTPIFFPKSTLNKLKTSVRSERLVKIYIQKKKNNYFLIIASHHIALDGWSAVLLREEIFRRYEGRQEQTFLNRAEEIEYLNKVNEVWLQNNDTINELKLLLTQVNPLEYNQLDSLFNGVLHQQHSCFVIEKERVDQFARHNKIQEFPYSVIFALLLQKLISELANVNKLFFYVSFSNRNLPVPNIKKLITNLATGLPVFFDSSNKTLQELAQQIQASLTIYFKNMNYAALADIWQNEIINRSLLSPREQPYRIVYTYINKVAGDEYIQNKYIDWNQSANEINPGKKGVLFLRVYNLGSQFVVIFNSHMNKNLHEHLIQNLHELLV